MSGPSVLQSKQLHLLIQHHALEAVALAHGSTRRVTVAEMRQRVIDALNKAGDLEYERHRGDEWVPLDVMAAIDAALALCLALR